MSLVGFVRADLDLPGGEDHLSGLRAVNCRDDAEALTDTQVIVLHGLAPGLSG